MDNLEEFNHKYNNTLFRYIDDAKFIHSVELAGVDLDNNTVYLSSHKIGELILKYPTCLQVLQLDSPPTGLFNHRGYGIYLFKVPARQWRRGLCSENHELYNPFSCLFNERVYKPIFGLGVAQSIFNPSYVKIENAIETLNQLKNSYSIAISNKLMLSKSPSSLKNECLLWYKTIPIGTIQQHQCYIEDPLYEQEVCDELEQIGEASWIS